MHNDDDLGMHNNDDLGMHHDGINNDDDLGPAAPEWEADRGMPGLPAALRLAGVLGVPVERLADGVEDPAGDRPGPSRATRKKRRSQRPPGLT
jgi:hypothetical protein